MKRGRGRPRIELDIEKLRKCAEKQWEDVEIGDFFGCSVDTLHRHYREVIDGARASGRAKLKDIIWKRAIDGSDRMLEHAANRFLGAIPRKIEITREQAIEFLEKELEQSGVYEDSDDSSESEDGT